MKKAVTTFCRICEPSCGLIAEVEDHQLLRLRPDPSHPVTKGFACHKGLGFDAIHYDPDRLNKPMKRVNTKSSPSTFIEIDWQDAITEVAGALKNIQARHGPDAVAGYIGNPMAFNALGTQAMNGFFRQLGVNRLFNCITQDCSNKFAGSEAVFGTSTLLPIPDLAHTHYALIFGENPKVSHMSTVSIANPMEHFRKAVSRGATVKFINPRHIESATPATGNVVLIRPDTDLYLMAALLHEIDAAGLFDEETLFAHGKNVEGLREFIAPYNADAVADITGVPAAEIRRMAIEFAKAESACVHMSTGVNMGRQGTLCYWLLHMLSFVTGNLDKKGGNLYGLGFYPAVKNGRASRDEVFFSTEFGDIRYIRGWLPGNLLADMIEAEHQPVRALVVVAGNPILSMAGESRLRQAFTKLELVVVLDIYRNATGELADYLLPCTDMLERSDLTLCGLGMQYEPFVQYTDAVLPAKHERKEEWWIFGTLEQALGLPSVFDGGEPPDLFAKLNKMLSYSHLSIEQLKSMPQQTYLLPKLQGGRFYQDWIQTDDKRVDCCPALFGDAIKRASSIFGELKAESPGQLKLIHLRTNYMHNSWHHNVPGLKRIHQQFNPLHICSADANRLALEDGKAITVKSRWGEIAATIKIDDSLRQGVVAMTHGWGNQKTFGLNVARKFPGVNMNALLPSGPGSFEKISNQAHMTGIPVEIMIS